ncbi:hypothetical protein P4O66_004882, partial [Electrophorus voltai]
SWSKEVAASSQDWANTCAMAHGPPSSRMIREGYQMGENLFQSTTPLTWTDVVTAWHSEYKNYKYGFGSINGKSIGHYTQVVWYSSYKVGCGIAKCGDRYFYSCRYYRAGNFNGVAPYTEGVPCSACPQACEDKLCSKCHYTAYCLPQRRIEQIPL